MTVTIEEGTLLDVTASATMGSPLLLGATSLDLSVAYTSTGPTPTAVVTHAGLSVGAGEKTIFTLNGLIAGLPAGTYTIGLAASTTDAQWTNNGTGATLVRVLVP